MLNIFYQFDPEEDDGSRKGKITKDNFVMCLQTISKSMHAKSTESALTADSG